jgi:hypothetical protein
MHFALIYDGLKFFALHTVGVFLHGAPERERVAYAAVKRQCGACFIAWTMRVRAAGTQQVRIPYGRFQRPVIKIVMPGAAIDDLYAVHAVEKDSGVLIPEGMSLYDQYFILEGVIKRVVTHSVHIGISAQKGFVDAIYQIIVVIFGEAQFHTQYDVHTQLVCALFCEPVACKKTVYARVPIVGTVEKGDVSLVHVIGDDDACILVFVVQFNKRGGGNPPAPACFLGVNVRVIKEQAHRSSENYCNAIQDLRLINVGIKI